MITSKHPTIRQVARALPRRGRTVDANEDADDTARPSRPPQRAGWMRVITVWPSTSSAEKRTLSPALTPCSSAGLRTL